jgi:UDP-N-acetylmuramate dehydrogenase
VTIEPRPQAFRERLLAILGERVSFDFPTARLTSLRVGGPADAVVRPESRDELRRVLELAEVEELPVYVIGGGFNTLVRDAGLRGIVLQLTGFRTVRIEPSGAIYAEAGASHASVTRFCAEQGRTGLEFAVGIPGTVGGWIAMNAGVPEREMASVVERIEALMPGETEPVDLPRSELRFRYRALEEPEDALVLSARFHTEEASPEEIQERMREHLAHRKESQPVDRLSCGSVFKNPTGDHAGRLIEAVGLKGAREGDAEISEVHANFIVNRGSATASDVLRLVERAHAQVLRQVGIDLEPEVRVLGDWE